MSELVLVRSSLRRWDYGLLFLTGLVCLVLAGVAVALGKAAAGAVLLILALGLVVVGMLLRHIRIQSRLWVQDLGDGFRIMDRSGDGQFTDDQVLSMATSRKNRYSEGGLQSIRRRVRLWLATDDPRWQELVLMNEFKVGGIEPLRGLVDRLERQLLERARDDLASGRPVLGECWSWEQKTVSVHTPKETRTCTLDELAAIDHVGDDICLWRQGQEEVFARVPRASAHAVVLHRLVAEHLAQRPARASAGDETGLGHLMFERGGTRAGGLLLLLLAFILLVVGGGVLFTNLAKPLVGILILAGSALAVLLGLVFWRWRFRCHRHGVYLSSLFGERRLLDIQVGSITYRLVRNYYHGAYISTTCTFLVEPLPEVGGKSIRYSVSKSTPDEELERLCERVGRTITDRMRVQLAAGQRVLWTKSLAFVGQGLEYRPSTWFGRKDPVVIKFENIASYKIDQGKFLLWEQGKKKQSIKVETGAANFFPGYYLLGEILD